MQSPEAVVQRYSIKKVLLEISQNSQENTCARVSFLSFVKFLRIPFFIEHLRWLLLNHKTIYNRNILLKDLAPTSPVQISKKDGVRPFQSALKHFLIKLKRLYLLNTRPILNARLMYLSPSSRWYKTKIITENQIPSISACSAPSATRFISLLVNEPS